MTSCLGIQKQCLAQLETTGPDILIDPKKFLNNCSLSGLIPFEEALSSTSIESKRKAILSLALKYGQLSFLVTVIEHWASGEWSKVGCDCRFFLDWVWEEVCRIKQAIDESTTCLFDGSGLSLDEPTYATLFGYQSTLKSLKLLIERLILQGTATTEEGHHELEMRREATDLIAMYLKIILWLYRSGLLPESSYEDDNEADEEENPKMLESRIYPRSLLSRTYGEWRRELHQINPSVIGLTDILLIDGITTHLKDQLTTIWEEVGGNKDALYPPPNIHALVRVYLLESVPLELKHTLMLYFLMDIASYLGQKRTDIEERIKLFPSYFYLKLGVSKLVEGIWAIDNKFFDFGLTALSFPQVQDLLINAQVEDLSERCLRDSLQKRLVTSLLYQDRHKDALRLVRSLGLFEIDSPDKERLYVSILARNRQLFQAFMFQRSCRNKQNAEEILMHFYLACEQMNLISQLFQLPLDSVEEEGLIYYLINISSSRDAKHLLILYLLLKGKVIEAHQFRESYREELESTQDDELFQRGMHLSAIIDSYMANLPKALTRLADEINAFEMARLRDKTPSQAPQFKRTEKPQPPPTPIIKTQPDTILKLIEEMEEAYREAETGQKSVKESSTPFREKIQQRGLLLTRDSPFIRAPFPQTADMGQRDSPLQNLVAFRDEARDRDTSFRSTSSLRKDRKIGEDSFLTPTKPVKTKTKVPFTSSEISMVLRTPPVKSASKVKSKSTPPRDDSCFTPISILKVKNTSESGNILSLPSPNSQRTRKSVSMQESSLTLKIPPPPSSSTLTENIGDTTLTQSIIEESRDAESEIDDSNFRARFYKDTFDLKFGGEVAGGGEVTISDITSDTIPGDDNISISSKKDTTMSSETGSTTTDEDHHSRRVRSKKPKDANPSHPMQLRASSAKKKSSSKK